MECMYCVMNMDHVCFVYAYLATKCTLYMLHWGHYSMFFIGSIKQP